MDLSLQFKHNGTAHDDLILRFAGQTRVCDTYYLAIDRGLLPEREDDYKVRAVLRRLLEQWLTAVENIRDGGIIYLPYDFSDEYTGWLQGRRSDNLLELSLGWAAIGGWSFYPSAVGEYLTQLSDFHPDGPSIQVTVAELVQAIQESISL